MASFRVMTKNGWKGPFPEASLISKYRQGGIPDGTRIQDAASGGEMTIEDLVSDATVILQKSAYGPAAAASPAKLTAAEARAATQKLPDARPRKPDSSVTAPRKASPEPKHSPQPESPSQPAPKLPTKGPLPKFPARAGASGRATAIGTPEKKSRGINWLFVLGCLCLLGGIGGPFLSFESGSASGDALLLFGYDLPLRLTTSVHEFAWQPSAPLVWAFNALFMIYLVPLMALVALLDEFLSKAAGRNRWYLRLLVALVAPACALAIAALFFSAQAAGIAGDEAIPQGMREAAGFQAFLQATLESGRGFFSIGPYALAAGSVLCLLSVVISPRAKKAEMPKPAPKTAA